jgi:hypothetical protein
MLSMRSFLVQEAKKVAVETELLHICAEVLMGVAMGVVLLEDGAEAASGVTFSAWTVVVLEGMVALVFVVRGAENRVASLEAVWVLVAVVGDRQGIVALVLVVEVPGAADNEEATGVASVETVLMAAVELFGAMGAAADEAAGTMVFAVEVVQELVIAVEVVEGTWTVFAVGVLGAEVVTIGTVAAGQEG